MRKHVCVWFCVCITGMHSCKKQNGQVISQPSHVYVVGFERSNGSALAIAEYWKDGSRVTLTDSPVESLASAIAVIGNDVYVAGYRIFYDSLHQGRYYGTLWVNGHPGNLGVNLPDQNISSYPLAMAVSGTDLYIAGYEEKDINNLTAKYWVNGKEISMTNGTSSVANGITIAGKDIYIAGSGISYTGKYVARYWKNGAPINLTDGKIDTWATSIAVVGKDIYVCGYEIDGPFQYVVKYWKNSNFVNLTAGTTEAYATGIGVLGTDVYVTGKEYVGGIYYARVWKNGTMISLPYSTPYSQATSVTISGSDLYITGVELNGTALAPMYWKNGNPTMLSSMPGLPETKSIFIAAQ